MANSESKNKSGLLGRFKYNDREVFGKLDGSEIELFESSKDLAQGMSTLGDSSAKSERVSSSKVTWLPPLDERSRVFAVALNYRPHATETGAVPPERPLLFYKPPSAFVGHNGTLQSHPEFTSKYDYEGEVGVVIGRRCSRATKADALSYVGGICALMDGSSRDRLRVNAGKDLFHDWLSSKAADGASMIGPVVACGPEVIKALQDRTVTVETKLNGDVVQQGTISEMVFSVEELIVALSEFMTLLPGDVIATGTPGGIGQARGRFIRSGDVVSISVSGLPPLVAKCG